MNTNPSARRARSVLRGVLVGAAVTLAAWALSATTASAAPGGSIAYVKDGNIFLASPDGARSVQVTTSGAYASVSQADDGTMIALTGERLHELSRSGTVQADFATPISDGPPPADPSADHFQGPFFPRISPDGTRVAYAYYWRHFTWDPTCNGFQGCYRTRLESGTAITYSHRLTEWAEFGGPLTGWKWATWIDNDRIVRGDPGVVLAEGAVINRIAPGLGHNDMLRWIPHNYDLVGDPIIDRTGTWFAASVKTWTTFEWSIQVSRMRPLPEQPEFCFKIPAQEPALFGAPSFSPDGTALAWQDKDGLHVMPLPAECAAPQSLGALAVPGASSPSWGPAGLPALGTSGGPASRGTVTIASRTLSRNAITRGAARIRVRVPQAGRVSITVRQGTRIIARGSAQAAAAGTLAVKLRRSVAPRHLRTAAARITVTFTPASGPRQSVRSTVRLAR